MATSTRSHQGSAAGREEAAPVLRRPTARTLLDTLEDDPRRYALERSTRARVDRQRVLHREGERIEWFTLVASGSVKLVRDSLEGRQLISRLALAGDGFGATIEPVVATTLAQALEPTEVVRIPTSVVRRLVATSARFASSLLAMSEAHRLAAETATFRLAFDTVARRLALLLLEMSRETTGALHAPLNQTEIAGLIGSSRETVCSVLNRLRRDGLLALDRGRIRVVDRFGLARVR